MSLRYVLADVFTDQPFGGNPLAVFPEADDIPAPAMPLIARELNLSETAFVLSPARGGTHRLRIFTPGTELPFAGHPTVGAACVLLSEGKIELKDGRASLVFEEGVGPVEVTAVRSGTRIQASLRTARLPERGPAAPPVETLARLLSLSPEDIRTGDWAPACFSCGVPFLIVPLRDRETLGRARLNHAVWARSVASTWAPHVYLLAPCSPSTPARHPASPGGGPAAPDVRVRMFAPAMGIAEDPATGAAAAAAAGYLADLAPAGRGDLTWVFEQGVEMGRPSRLLVTATRAAGSIDAVYVAGETVRIGEGRLTPAVVT